MKDSIMDLAEFWTTLKWRWEHGGVPTLGLCSDCHRPIWPWQPAVTEVSVDQSPAPNVNYHSVCWELKNEPSGHIE